MTKQIYILLVIFHLPFMSFSQGPIAQEINELIQAGEIDKAEKRVEFYLKKNPKEVDAIMMKGNIILNKECCDRPTLLEANTDESIYSNSIGSLGDGGPMVASEETGRKVANLWKQAVGFDLTRTDIHFGICQIYSISMMTDEVIAYLPTLKKHVTNGDKLHYSMCDYARNLKERGDFESAIKIYKNVIMLYPEETGLYSDLAAEFFFHGDIDLAKKNIDKALEDVNLDQMSLGNAFFFNSVMGNYDDALNCLKRQAKITNMNEYLFYQGLLNFSNETDWKADMKAFLKVAENKNWIQTAEYMLSDEFGETFESYLKLNEMNLNDGFKILIHKAFKTKTPGALAPFFNYAELLTYNKLYNQAIIEFENIKKLGLIKDEGDEENISYYYGWALWKSGTKEKSLEQWESLSDSENFQYRSASAYFTGKFYYDLDNREKAKKYFGLVQEEANKSKYATMAWNYYNSLN